MSKDRHDYKRFVFLDRDGVINVEHGTYTMTIDEWEWNPEALEGIQKLTESTFGVIVITNQACIAKGLQTEDGLNTLHTFMLDGIRKAGGDILRIYHCPHVTEDGCPCRKPKPGMLLKAAQDFDIRMQEAFFIGDSLRDMEAGRRAGTRMILITSGHGADSPRTQFEPGEFEAATFSEAVEIVLKETSSG